MTSLEKLSADMFNGLLGSLFTMTSDRAYTVKLVDVSEFGAPMRGGPQRTPFSLIFEDEGNIVAAQGMFRLEHSEIESIEIFMVPIEPRDGCFRYQAIFS